MRPIELIGKGAEILNYIAEKEPDKRKLRLRWSSRTIWKQIRRLENQGLIVWQDDNYQATDQGLYALALAWAPRSRAAVTRIVKIAIRKFPDGATVQGFGSLSKIGQPNLKERLMRDLEKPNTFLVYRTKAKGEIAWMFSTNRGPEDFRISERVHGRWRRVHFPKEIRLS